MANETIVPTRGNLQTDLGGNTPNIGGFQFVQPSQFSAPPQVEWTAPSRSNELLQVSEALADLNPQLRGFGTTFTRYEALQEDLQKKLAETDAQILSIDNAREINRKGVNELIANGTLKAEQTPAYYTNLQRFVAERVAKTDFPSFVLNATNQATGQPKYVDRLNDWNSTEDPNQILQEAIRDWVGQNPNSSQIYTDASYKEANRQSERLAESAVTSRWNGRKAQMEETLSQEGQDILTETELNNEDPQPKMQAWLNKTKYVPGAFKKWAENSLQPFVLRMAMDNPDGARNLLAKYENIQTETGARLGAGSNFGVFQSTHARIDQIEKSQEKNNELSREAMLQATGDYINNQIIRVVDEAGGNTNVLLDNNVKQKLISSIGKNALIQMSDNKSFRMDENSALYGTARNMLERSIEATMKTGNNSDLRMIADFKMAIKDNPERAEQLFEAIDTTQGWGFGENSRAKASAMLEEMRSGIGLMKSKPIMTAVDKVSKYISQLAVDKGDPIGPEAITQVANPSILSQEIIDELRPEIEKAKKENPKLTDSEIINDKIGDVAVKVQEKALKRVNEQKFKLENNLDKTENKIKQNENAVEVPLGTFFEMGDGYQGQSLSKVSTLENKFNYMVKLGLKLKDAGIDINSPNLTASDKRTLASHEKYRQNIFERADKILPLLAKDIITGEFPLTDSSKKEKTYIKYGVKDLERKQDEYWRLKSMRGFKSEEIASGRTSEGLVIPAFTQNTPNPIGERVRNYATHFESLPELDKLIAEYQSGNKDNNLGRIFKAYNLTTDADQDSYVQQQVYLLKVMR